MASSAPPRPRPSTRSAPDWSPSNTSPPSSRTRWHGSKRGGSNWRVKWRPRWPTSARRWRMTSASCVRRPRSSGSNCAISSRPWRESVRRWRMTSGCGERRWCRGAPSWRAGGLPCARPSGSKRPSAPRRPKGHGSEAVPGWTTGARRKGWRYARPRTRERGGSARGVCSFWGTLSSRAWAARRGRPTCRSSWPGCWRRSSTLMCRGRPLGTWAATSRRSPPNWCPSSTSSSGRKPPNARRPRARAHHRRLAATLRWRPGRKVGRWRRGRRKWGVGQLEWRVSILRWMPSSLCAGSTIGNTSVNQHRQSSALISRT
mmetsp:Transcript_15428/g.35796  ORF Transcript_15428/g.35796 Transcript_15428/m.35796 type:complete len:316 (-) Transcript_15428:1001-1948(-)